MFFRFLAWFIKFASSLALLFRRCSTKGRLRGKNDRRQNGPPSRTLTRKFRMCPRVEKGLEEADAPRDVTAWRFRVTALGASSSFFSRSMMIPITSGLVNLFLLFLFPLFLLLSFPLLPDLSFLIARRRNGARDWWSCACCIQDAVARYVDIPLAYRLHCRIKACERSAICCSNKCK